MKIVWITQFAKDYKRAKKRDLSLKELKKVAQKLAQGEKLEPKYKDHSLKGSFKKGYKECHIKPDWLLIYRIEKDELVFVRTGTHSDLFK